MSRPLLQKIWRLPRLAVKRFITALLRVLLLINRPARLARSGFVLPTTVLLVLMVVLTVTALTYRTFSRSSVVMSQREQQVVTNAASPAIERAKAKIEFLFRSDPRFPSGVPSSDVLADLMLPQLGPQEFAGYTGRVGLLNNQDPYTLPDERRVDINGDGLLDNAWFYTTDIDGDGDVTDDEIVTYSILVDDAVDVSERVEAAEPDAGEPEVEDFLRRPYVEETVGLTSADAEAKANALITRTGPLATTEATPLCQGAVAESGWQLVTQGDSSTLQKNFQINAFVANRNAGNRSFETLEFQQSRIASRASKWGAWFRYDLEIHPGPDFRWNGAMHTDGNLVLWGRIQPFMISSQNSCLYSKEASEITMGSFDNDGTLGISLADARAGEVGDFQGQVIAAKTDGNAYTAPNAGNNAGSINVHVFDTRTTAPDQETLTRNNDSVDPDNGSTPADVAMNPLLLFTQDVESHVNPEDWQRDEDWEGNEFNEEGRERIYNGEVARPFVDDFYRADNRWGPKPRYTSAPALDLTSADNVAAGLVIGDQIQDRPELTNPENGLDGYWERQAIATGLRLIVGERLELGNAVEWNFDPTAGVAAAGDPLYPHDALKTENLDVTGGAFEHLQRKTLRDNLAAVQGMVVYHYDHPSSEEGEFPAACLAMTAHPGTRQSIVNSRTFTRFESGNIRTDFFSGNGTNGWEFAWPDSFNTSDGFAAEIVSTRPLGIALRNLAHFAGDPLGGAPSFRPEQETVAAGANVFPHPYPYLSMWGDFSTLHRVLDRYDNVLPSTLNARQKYDALSPADRSTLHTAACTLSMLAYNISEYNEELESNLNALDTELGTVQNIGTQLRTEFGDLVAFVRPDLKTGNFNANNPSFDANWPASKNPRTAGASIPGCVEDAAFRAAYGSLQCDLDEYFANFTLDDMIQVFRASRPNGETAAKTGALVTVLEDMAKAIKRLTVLTRDRELGFSPGFPSFKFIDGYTENVQWNPSTGKNSAVNIPGLASSLELATSCNPNVFQRTASGSNDSTSQSGQNVGSFRVSLALVICSEVEQAPVRYPSLFYLFPVENHGHAGDEDDGNAQPAAEEYIDDEYIADVNETYVYQVVRENATADAVTGLNVIAAEPRTATVTTWNIPASTATGPLTVDNVDGLDEVFKINAPNREPTQEEIDGGQTGPVGVVLRVPFLDKGVYDGRELMNSRLLDIDLQVLTTRRVGTDRDLWLPADLDNNAEGTVYAFREDAVREDEIVRPRRADIEVDDCTEFRGITGNDTRIFQIEIDGNCQVAVDSDDPRDPPLTAQRISLKPVDFVPEPLRRVNGFRLRSTTGNPVDLSGGNAATGRQVGLTFVTDNAVHIKGDFNPHSSNGTTTAANRLEEFTDRITTTDFTFANFYGGRDELDTTRFANLAVDHWRPAEILTDAMYIESNNFIDGAVSDTFVSTGGATSSYTNQPRPIDGGDIAVWVHENPDVATSPVWVDRNGTYYFRGIDADENPVIVRFFDQFDTAAEWVRVQDNKALIAARETFVNATMVSGISVKRPNQGYGGLHNFPRFLENWGGRNLFIQGAFIQLNFSTTNTAPFEQEALEPGQTPVAAEQIRYYAPPPRRWGYDVGLLYVPPAPAARRFVTIGSPRSEYYRELPANDPYIVNLRCARVQDGETLTPLMADFCPS